MLEGPVDPDTVECSLVSQFPVDILGGRLLGGEPVVVVVLRLPHPPLLVLVVVRVHLGTLQPGILQEQSL